MFRNNGTIDPYIQIEQSMGAQRVHYEVLWIKALVPINAYRS